MDYSDCSLQGIDLDFSFICKSLHILLMQEIIRLYLLLSFLWVVCSPYTHAHTLLRHQSLLQHFAHSHCICKLSELRRWLLSLYLPFLAYLKLPLTIGFGFCPQSFTHWSTGVGAGLYSRLLLIVLFHQIGLFQHLSFHTSNCTHLCGFTNIVSKIKKKTTTMSSVIYQGEERKKEKKKRTVHRRDLR